MMILSQWVVPKQLRLLLQFSVVPGQTNILLPRPGYPFYKSCAAFCGIEARDYNLNLERNWEIDLDSLKSVADKITVAMVVINPGNPCGNVFTCDHIWLRSVAYNLVAQTAKKLGILVIADEVYYHLTFGTKPFVPMGTFGSLVPVLTVGSLSKRWVVPGWRLGWIAVTDPRGYMLWRIKEIDCITCPYKPEGAMSAMVKLDLSLLEDILDDVDFCCKLAKEESVIIIPGSAEPSTLEDGLERVKSFCQRHAKKH
ncbi:putative aminotransferase TAT2 isoform X2 [Cinnamomum micranthum f. kanehirae]|uniref:Putative aminotransferase TAT2 isoform X2 n=1 Tax=Cinnamomum micranthum f. kanehirae TaxID=337451 RepID=A0A443PFN5_9MAGN|nr:putative aminotransferase TAT2 isoform X2 [Cinnamomum micranthum f. kanehirae]